jgi:hypothetical protein
MKITKIKVAKLGTPKKKKNKGRAFREELLLSDIKNSMANVLM